jgi:drug/metabolite transporter (DMT)-like permease
VPVGIVAVVLLTWAPISAFLAWAVLGEGLSSLQVAGAAIILAALVIARPN